MSFLGFTSTRLVPWNILPTKKNQRIQCSSNPGTLDFKSNTLPLSHPGPLTHSHKITPFDALGKQGFENTVGKGEITRNEQFLLFPVFSTHLDNFLPFSSNLKLSSANSNPGTLDYKSNTLPLSHTGPRNPFPQNDAF